MLKSYIAYIPNILALLRFQVKYYTDAHKTYSDLAAQLQKQTGQGEESSDQYSQRIQQKLGEIRALSITVDR